MRSPHAGEDRAREPAGEGPEDEGPVAKSRCGERQRRDRGRERLRAIRPGEPAKVEIASQQRPRHRLGRRHKECQAPHHDDRSDGWLPEEPRYRSGQGRRKPDQHAADHQSKAAQPGDLVAVQVPALHDREAQPEFVHELHEPEVDHGHADQAVVGRRQQLGDHQGRGPSEDLRGPARRTGPRETPHQGAVKLARRGRLALHDRRLLRWRAGQRSRVESRL